VNTDLSVAPEIARLAAPLVPAQHVVAVPRTDGRVAGDLADLAASPERWWDLVRFDSSGPVRIPLPSVSGSSVSGSSVSGSSVSGSSVSGSSVSGSSVSGSTVSGSRVSGSSVSDSRVSDSWLLVLPPGLTADCDCHQATALAGEAVELGVAGVTAGAGAGRPLRPGRVRVHGVPAAHRLRAVGPGYSVTLHATASRPRSN